MTCDRARLVTAYHEAGHAAVALCEGWWLRPPGVQIEPDGIAHIDPAPADWTIRRYAHVTLGGPMAEFRHKGRVPPFRTDERRLDSVRAAREYVAHDTYEGDQSHDGVQMAGALLVLAPEADEAKLLRLLHEAEASAWAAVNDTDTWAAIERMAAALYERGALTPGEAAALVKNLPTT